MREKIEQVVRELEESMRITQSKIQKMKGKEAKMLGHGINIGMEKAIKRLNAIIAEDRTAEAEETRCRG